MSSTSTRVDTRADPRNERLQPWIAALLSLLLHVLMLLILLHDAPPTFASAPAAASGGRMKMEFIGKSTDPATLAPPSPPPTRAATPPSRKTPKKPTVQRKPANARVQTTLVEQAQDPVPDDDAASIPTTTADDSWSMPSQAQRVQQPSQAPANPPPPSQSNATTWGRPPGMLDRDTAMDNGLADSPSTSRGSQRGANAAGASLEVGGYSAFYEPRTEERVRDWMKQGMKEFFIPLPGTRYVMVCPLEIVMRHGSGKCRALDPSDPQMQGIGDSRDIITMLRVYKQGELVWKGPGPYR